MLFKIEGIKPIEIGLPSIKKSKKRPLVLSREEMRRLLNTPDLLVSSQASTNQVVHFHAIIQVYNLSKVYHRIA